MRQDNPAKSVGQALPKHEKLRNHRKVLHYSQVRDPIDASNTSGAEEAIRCIAGFYAVERRARSQQPDERVRFRDAHFLRILDDLDAWLHSQLSEISGKSELAKAIRYAVTG